MPKKKKKTAPKPDKPLPKPRTWYVRKRDKTVVRIESVGKVVTYRTMPLLLVYDTATLNFHKNFRLATAEEAAPYMDSLP